MSVIAAYNPAIRVPTVPDAKSTAETAVKAQPTAPAAETKVVEGVTVTISGAAFKAVAVASKANSDIDDSGLDDSVKQILKMIRKLKQQIAEKMAELQAVATNNSLTPEQIRVKTNNIQGAISSLQAGLMTAQGSLLKAMKSMSADGALKAASLAM
ncbi:hypothetical protein GIW50_13725 [Pseudomonas syringae]|uniref:Chemotaxis protein n=1 Tax=Pseudomonas syringae TaxID=317 RepID=A0A9Q3ZXI0_PSESX|nr:hypothetical protein [Pseudomonas syringae]MCF5062409.1 hypothetical protein [Pseudomonas syringae]MCF5072604.1 hypothetical protein [Pseudomonas syringae]MCF5119457.1 hypothetical protein [Pseudomonas syringae]MCF5379465.1 hypothetical protein [Pseudomonas syringae]